MKTILPALCALLLTALPAPAQTPTPQLDGFLGVPFGTDPETAKKELPPRSHSHLDRAKSKDAAHLWFEGGKFAGFKADHIAMEFIADRLWNIEVHLQAVSKDHEKEFATLQQMLVEKYGPGQDEAATNRTHSWYVPGTIGKLNTIRITTDPAGVGLIVWYLCDDVRTSGLPKPAPPPAAPQPAKPLKTSPTAKDDL